MGFNRRIKGLDYPIEGTPAISLCLFRFFPAAFRPSAFSPTTSCPLEEANGYTPRSN